MIYGVGTDIVQHSRIEATYRRFGEHFVNRLLLDEERELFEKTKWPTRGLARRFAAKEATVKATITRNPLKMIFLFIRNQPPSMITTE